MHEPAQLNKMHKAISHKVFAVITVFMFTQTFQTSQVKANAVPITRPVFHVPPVTFPAVRAAAESAAIRTGWVHAAVA